MSSCSLIRIIVKSCDQLCTYMISKDTCIICVVVKQQSEQTTFPYMKFEMFCIFYLLYNSYTFVHVHVFALEVCFLMKGQLIFYDKNFLLININYDKYFILIQY